MPDAEELDLDLLLRPRTGFYLTSLISQTPTVSNRILITHKTKKATAKKRKGTAPGIARVLNYKRSERSNYASRCSYFGLISNLRGPDAGRALFLFRSTA